MKLTKSIFLALNCAKTMKLTKSIFLALNCAKTMKLTKSIILYSGVGTRGGRGAGGQGATGPHNISTGGLPPSTPPPQ